MTYQIHRVAVLGAGTMGAAIAAHAANAGLSVDLLDIAPPGAQGKDRNVIVKAGFERLKEADWILEAIIEKLEAKQELMARLEQVVKDKAIISSNTSGIPLSKIAEGRSESYRRRFLGTHFFNPPRYLKLLEIIPTADTDPEVVEYMRTFGGASTGQGGRDRERYAQLHWKLGWQL